MEMKSGKLLAFVPPSAALITLVILIGGCKKEEGPTAPIITAITANGNFVAQSRTQVTGVLFVVDQNGSPVGGLTAQNLAARLRWLPKGTGSAGEVVGTVNIQAFSSAGKNIAVALTMDYSGSMFVGPRDSANPLKYKRIADMERAAKTFVSNMRSGDVAEIIKFGSNVEVIQQFTNNKNALLAAIDTNSYSRGMTALYQSIYQGLIDAAQQPAASYVRAVVAFTDGGENNSTVSRSAMLRQSFSNGIPVYTVGLLDSSDHSTPPGLNSYEEWDLVNIADTTGGFYFYAPSAAEMAQIYQRISGVIQGGYTVTINWPATGLPPSGTTVTMTLTISIGGVSTTITKSYSMP